MNTAVRAVTAVAVSVILGACGARETGADGDLSGVQPAPAGAALVSVENHNWSDVVVYAVRNGSRQRLGMVTSQQRETFTIPPAFVAGGADLQLLVDPIGSRNAFLTAPILVQPGNVVEFSIENHLPLSNWSVRP